MFELIELVVVSVVVSVVLEDDSAILINAETRLNQDERVRKKLQCRRIKK